MLSHMQKFLLLLLLLLRPPPTVRPRSQPRGLNPSLEAQILAWRPKSQPPGPNPSLQAQISASRSKSQPPGPNPSLQAQIPASRPKSQPQGPNLSLQAQIPASRPKSQHPGPNPSIQAQTPASWLKIQTKGSNPSPKTQIPVLSIGHQILWGLLTMSKYMLQASNRALSPISQLFQSEKNSIGHRLLRGCCPSHHHTPTYTHIGAMDTANHLTLLRLFSLGLATP